MAAVKRVRRFRAGVPVALAALVVLYGIVALVPHTHGEQGVPRHDAVCTASGSPTPLFHLHPVAPLLPVPPCLACLLGPGVAATGAPAFWVLALVLLALQAGRRFAAGQQDAPVVPLSRGPPSCC